MADETGLDISTHEDVTVITLNDSYRTVDLGMIDDLQRALVDVAGKADPPKVVVDLPHTIAFDSSFIEILVRMRRLLTDQGGTMALSRLTPTARDVFKVTQLDTIFPCYGLRDEAVRDLSSP